MNRFKLFVCCVPFVLGMNSPTQAQNVIDMSRITCDQLLNGKENTVEVSIWLSGYYNGLRKNTKLDLDQFRKNAETVVAECKDRPKDTVMKAIKTIASRKK
jgi:hypothetical protein